MMGKLTEGSTMLIVEGPDGAGKTTLVERICEEFGVEKRPRSSTSENGPVDNLWDWVIQDMGSNVNVGVYDRHPLISEMIYGPILRGEIRLGPNNLSELSTMLRFFYGFNPLIIYCLPNIATVRVNVARNHDGETSHTKGVLRYTDHLYASYYYRMAQDIQRGVAMQWDYNQPWWNTLCQLIPQHMEIP